MKSHQWSFYRTIQFFSWPNSFGKADYTLGFLALKLQRETTYDQGKHYDVYKHSNLDETYKIHVTISNIT